MTEWKPIETAPKDGEYLVYQPEYKHHPRSQYSLVARVCLKSGEGFVRPSTHWMPLPAPPKHSD